MKRSCSSELRTSPTTPPRGPADASASFLEDIEVAGGLAIGVTLIADGIGRQRAEVDALLQQWVQHYLSPKPPAVPATASGVTSRPEHVSYDWCRRFYLFTAEVDRIRLVPSASSRSEYMRVGRLIPEPLGRTLDEFGISFEILRWIAEDGDNVVQRCVLLTSTAELAVRKALQAAPPSLSPTPCRRSGCSGTGAPPPPPAGGRISRPVMKRRRANQPRPRRAETPRELPAEWLPALGIREQIEACNLDLGKVMERYRLAQGGRRLKRWRQDTFLAWFDTQLLAEAFRDCTPVVGMAVVPGPRWKAKHDAYVRGPSCP